MTEPEMLVKIEGGSRLESAAEMTADDDRPDKRRLWVDVLLRGLKTYTSNLSAIVTVADDGGSSGRLRDEYRILPPGDFRQCLIALADAEPLMKQLFDHRFKEGSLNGHSF